MRESLSVLLAGCFGLCPSILLQFTLLQLKIAKNPICKFKEVIQGHQCWYH